MQVELQQQLQQSSRGSEAPAENYPEAAAEMEEIEVNLDESADDEIDLGELDIAAPGLNITTSDITGSVGYSSKNIRTSFRQQLHLLMKKKDFLNQS